MGDKTTRLGVPASTDAAESASTPTAGSAAVAHDRNKVSDVQRLEIAVSQAERQWGRDPRRNIRSFLDEPGERAQISLFLNGAFAEWVARYTECRWQVLEMDELDAVHSNADYAQLLYQHLQACSEANT